MTDNDMVVFRLNGIDGDTGKPAELRVSASALARRLGMPPDAEFLAEQQARHRQQTVGRAAPVAEGVTPWDLAQAGWGLLVAQKDPQAAAIVKALTPLLKHRKKQAGSLYREFLGEDGWRPGERKNAWLARHGVGPGTVDPTRGVPYYLLIVGGPEHIPFSFQYQLDMQFAVGRLAFERIEDYAAYARSVVEAETQPQDVARPRRISCFGISHPGDVASQDCVNELVRPLVEKLGKGVADWEVEPVYGEAANKAELLQRLGGDATPSVVFTGGHGLMFNPTSANQRHRQGAVLCSDWPGQAASPGPPAPECFVAAEDIGEAANPHGLVVLHFACFSAGTPHYDDFDAYEEREEPKPDEPIIRGTRRLSAPQPFVAALPQALLRRGALAVIGHVDRAWSHSFSWTDAGSQTTAFETVMKRLAKGLPVGYACEDFNLRFAELATELSYLQEELRFGNPNVDLKKVAEMWMAHNDARDYAVLGDPAVRLPSAMAEKRG